MSLSKSSFQNHRTPTGWTTVEYSQIEMGLASVVSSDLAKIPGNDYLLLLFTDSRIFQGFDCTGVSFAAILFTVFPVGTTNDSRSTKKLIDAMVIRCLLDQFDVRSVIASSFHLIICHIILLILRMHPVIRSTSSTKMHEQMRSSYLLIRKYFSRFFPLSLSLLSTALNTRFTETYLREKWKNKQTHTNETPGTKMYTTEIWSFLFNRMRLWSRLSKYVQIELRENQEKKKMKPRKWRSMTERNKQKRRKTNAILSSFRKIFSVIICFISTLRFLFDWHGRFHWSCLHCCFCLHHLSLRNSSNVGTLEKKALEIFLLTMISTHQKKHVRVNNSNAVRQGKGEIDAVQFCYLNF